MAKDITELTELDATPETNDLVILYDTSAGVTSKMTVSNLLSSCVKTSAIGTDVGDILQLVDVGGGVSGLPAVSGENLTGVLPSGVIVIWSGAVSAIPSGWTICDGTNGTPDLTDRFVIHADADAGGTNDVGDTGDGNGSTESFTLTQAEIPSHAHSGLGVGVSVSAGSGLVVLDTSPNATGNTGGGGGHDHDIADYKPKYYALAYIMKT